MAMELSRKRRIVRIVAGGNFALAVLGFCLLCVSVAFLQPGQVPEATIRRFVGAVWPLAVFFLIASPIQFIVALIMTFGVRPTLRFQKVWLEQTLFGLTVPLPVATAVAAYLWLHAADRLGFL